jgi:hypothetical protein
VYTLELVSKEGLIIGDRAMFLSADNACSGNNVAALNHGTFCQKAWKEILSRRIDQANRPLYEVHPFEGPTYFVLPDDQKRAPRRRPRAKRKFITKTSQELADAAKVVILSHPLNLVAAESTS